MFIIILFLMHNYYTEQKSHPLTQIEWRSFVSWCLAGLGRGSLCYASGAVWGGHRCVGTSYESWWFRRVFSIPLSGSFNGLRARRRDNQFYHKGTRSRGDVMARSRRRGNGSVCEDLGERARNLDLLYVMDIIDTFCGIRTIMYPVSEE